MTTIQPKFTPITRNDAGGQVAVSQTAPTKDKVIDLTSKENIQTELKTQDASFIRVKIQGKDAFFDLSTMKPEQKTAFVESLKDRILGVGEKGVRSTFNPETFFSIAGSRLKIGTTPTQNSGPTANIASSENILDKSLKKEDPVFDFMNGDYAVLKKGDTPANDRVGDQKKPAEWYNGFQVKQVDGKYEVSTYKSSLDKSGRKAPDLNTDGYGGKKGIEAYKQMLKNDFNFNGAVTDVRKAVMNDLGIKLEGNKWVDSKGKDVPKETLAKLPELYEKKFLESVVKKFDPAHPTLSKDQLTTIAQNVWSYAANGTDKSGNIDVGQLQGMLNLLDPEIVSSSSNNTYKENFAMTDAKGQSFNVPLGDGFHGKSTILQSRHLLESFKADTPISIGLGGSPFGGYDETILLTDISTSMSSEMNQFSKLLSAGGIDGDVRIGTFHDNTGTGGLRWAGGKVDAETAGTVLSTRNKPEFTVPSTSGMKESGIQAGIAALTPYLNTNVNEGDKTKRQLILFTDETDADPGKLAQLQELAKKTGFDIKLIISGQVNDAATTFKVIDVNKISATQVTQSTGSSGNGSNTLDWEKIAQGQGASTHKWSDYAK